MELIDLSPAIQRIREGTPDARAATYLRTYPDIIAAGTAPGQPDLSRFHRVALMAYGWMPRILRLNRDHISSAILVLGSAQVATADNWSTVPIGDLVKCLNSVVELRKCSTSRIRKFSDLGQGGRALSTEGRGFPISHEPTSELRKLRARDSCDRARLRIRGVL